LPAAPAVLALTDEGQALYERAQRILAEVDEAEAALTHGRVEAQAHAGERDGGVRPRPCQPGLPRSGRLHFKLSIDLTLTDRLVELIDEGMDVVVRIGAPKIQADDAQAGGQPPGRGGLRRTILHAMARRWAPAELAKHECLHYRGVGSHWRLVDPGR